MEARQDPEITEGGGGTEGEDIPSDFFDEFNKEEFIEGLSIIDSWDEGIHSRERSRKQFTDSVKDLNEFSLDDNLESIKQVIPKKKKKKELSRLSRSPSSSRLDEFIKPGSRRDPTKTNEAIKKDKEEKVKEYLAKSLESSEDLRPPGTELDGYFDINTQAQMKMEKTPVRQKLDASPEPRSRSRDRQPRDSPMKQLHRRESPAKNSHRPRWSPRRSPRRVTPPRRSPPRRSHYRAHSPQKNHRGNIRRPSPNRRSPRRYSPRRSPRRSSPRRSPRRIRRSRSRSPYKRSYESRRSRSRSSNRMQGDRFLYPDSEPSYPPMSAPYHMPPGFSGGPAPEFSGSPGYSFPPAYSGGYTPSNSYEYGGPSMGPRGIAPPPQTLPAPLMSMPVSLPNPVPVPPPTVVLPPNPLSVPMMVPAPNLISPNLATQPFVTQPAAKTPYDALAKLVAEGKISKEDYLKLAPNKGPSSIVEDNHRVVVVNRCNQALTKLVKLQLPNHLLMNNSLLEVKSDPKYIAPKFCSPLKRQVPIEFLFTKVNVSASTQQNKHLVDSILACLPELERVIARPKKKVPKNMKDAAVQTSKPFCDVCEIRENTQYNSISTSINPEHFCSTVHTQVVEQDLINSKSVFNTSGSIGDGAPMSIAHLTPAQLVSQLAARAKTLKQPDPASSSQYQRAPSNSYDYEYDGRGGQQYQNYNNYRY